MNNAEPLHFPKFISVQTEVFFSASATTRITHMAIQNNHTSPVNVTVYIVPPSQAATDEFIAFDGLIAPKQSKVLYPLLGTMMGQNWSIQAKCTLDGVATLRSSGTYKT